MMLIQFGVAFLATISFSILFSAPKKNTVFCGLTGAFGWIIYYLLTQSGISDVAACVTATFVLTVMSRAFAAIFRIPGTVYLLSGIFPLVPGAGIYYTAYYMFRGDHAMSGAMGLQTFEVAAAIVFGIIFGFAIPQVWFNRFGKLFHKKKENE